MTPTLAEMCRDTFTSAVTSHMSELKHGVLHTMRHASDARDLSATTCKPTGAAHPQHARLNSVMSAPNEPGQKLSKPPAIWIRGHLLGSDFHTRRPVGAELTLHGVMWGTRSPGVPLVFIVSLSSTRWDRERGPSKHGSSRRRRSRRLFLSTVDFTAQPRRLLRLRS